MKILIPAPQTEIPRIIGMKKRHPIKACFVFILGFLFTSLQSISVPELDRPNVLWLTSEDNSAEWLACYGNPYSDTPNIDGLAREGFQYMNAYANAPVCAPSRSTWITGVLALSMGTHPMRSYNKIPHHRIQYYPDFLNERGYYTGNFTKTDYNIGGRANSECWDNPDSLDWEHLKEQQPFFQVINFGQSHESKAFGDIDHTEHDPAETILAKYHPDVSVMRKNYAHYHDAVKAMDASIGLTLEKLEAMGLKDNTIVIYNSDHGGVMPRSKRFLFQNSLHCPLIVRIPERFKEFWPSENPGSRVDRLVSFVDMPKTWLSLTGATVPDYMQGTIFLGPQTEPESRYHFAFRGRMDERLDNARAVCDKRYLYIRNYMPYVPWLQKLTFLWKMRASQIWDQLVTEGQSNEIQSRFFAPKQWTEELYDMQNDSDNIDNLIDNPEYLEIASAMRQQLRKQQLEIFDAGLIPESDMVRLAERNNMTIYELAHNPALYDVSALLDAADLALEEKEANLPKLRNLLNREQLGLRYWGMVGCFLLNDKEAGERAIADESHEVRAMAAWTLIRTGEQQQGIDCLRQLIEEDTYAMLTVLNMVEWIGDVGSELMPEVRKLEFVETYRNQFKYRIRMRDHLIERFGE